MPSQQTLLSLWVWILLLAALCPGPQYAYCKRGNFKGRGKSEGGDKGSSSQSRGLSMQGLKWAGAAAAGMLGGTGTGYGLGFLGRPKHDSGNHYSRKKVSSEHQQHYQEGRGYHNQSLWRAFVKSAAPATPMTNIFLILGHVLPFLITAAWIRDI